MFGNRYKYLNSERSTKPPPAELQLHQPPLTHSFGYGKRVHTTITVASRARAATKGYNSRAVRDENWKGAGGDGHGYRPWVATTTLHQHRVAGAERGQETPTRSKRGGARGGPGREHGHAWPRGACHKGH